MTDITSEILSDFFLIVLPARTKSHDRGSPLGLWEYCINLI